MIWLRVSHIIFPCNVVVVLLTLLWIRMRSRLGGDASFFYTKRCQICNLIDTRPAFTLPGTTSIVEQGSFSCNSSNVVYLVTCNKCCNGKGNYVGETSTKFRFRINNHKTSIHNNTPGHPVANHFNKNNHAAIDLECCILKEHFQYSKERQLCEKKLIVEYNFN